ncbi:MAG: hypothetical protein Q9228_007787 [Teloschistes exilis]
MRITDKKKRQWRDHASCLIDPPTWEIFKSYLLDLMSRPEIRAYDSEERLEKAAQRNGQTISDFVQYLESLWVTLDINVPNDQKTFALRNECLKEIRHRVLTIGHEVPTEYSKLLSYFVGVEQLLRKEGKLPPLTKSYNSDNGQSGQPTRSRGNPTRGQRAGRASSQSGRGGNTGGSGQKNQVRNTGPEFTCYSCGTVGHKAAWPKCLGYQEYLARQTNRELAATRGGQRGGNRGGRGGWRGDRGGANPNTVPINQSGNDNA